MIKNVKRDMPQGLQNANIDNTTRLLSNAENI